MNSLRISGLVLVAGLWGTGGLVAAEDWPAYQHDAGRSAVSADSISFPLQPIWKYEPLQRLRPAWPEAGRELNRLDFDYTSPPVVADGRVFVASSADDTLYALNALNGQALWHFTTGGPLRFAPALGGNRVFLASDDGYVYCLEAATGRLVWKFRAAPGAEQMLGNGRMISRWPLRCGVLLVEGVVYTVAGMWPSEGIYIYALEAQTGKVLWRNADSGDMAIPVPHPTAGAFTGVAPQGYLAASADTLLVPTGRSVPAAFDLKTGKFKYYLPSVFRSDGGVWITVAGELFLNSCHGPGPDIDVELGESAPRPGDGLKAYRVADGKQVFVLDSRQRAAVVNNTLYAVGGGVAEAYDDAGLKSGKLLTDCRKWSVPHAQGYTLMVAGQAVLIGSRGAITALSTVDGHTLWQDKVPGQVRGLAVAAGRVYASTETGQLFAYEANPVRLPVETVKLAPRWDLASPGEAAEMAQNIVKQSRKTEGYALVLGTEDVRLATSLALQSDLQVLVLLPGEKQVREQRESLLPTGLYGERITVQALPAEGGKLPFTPCFADLVVVAGEVRGGAGEDLYRLVRPCGGTLALCGLPAADQERLLREVNADPKQRTTAGSLVLVTRPALPGAAAWRYQWADTGRTGIGTDQQVKLPLRALWFGGPGPERMMSRHWGTSTPLSADGRVFVTGQNEVIAFDAYTGRDLWRLKMNGVGRVDAVLRSSNFVADQDSLYTTVGTQCFRIAQATGRIQGYYTMPEMVGGPASQPAPEKPDVPAVPSVEVEWPSAWTVFGPFPKAHTALPAAVLAGIPAELAENGRKYEPHAVQVVAGEIDLTFLLGGKVTSAEMERQTAYAFAKIKVPAEGLLRIGAGADYWMQWYLDGKPIHEGTKTDYRLGILTHVFTAPVTAGEHTLAVQVRAGSMGWMMISAGGLAYDRYLLSKGGQTGSKSHPEWEYLSVSDDLVLGTFQPAVDPNAEQWGLAKAIFAVDKRLGSARWMIPAQYGIPSTAIAFDEGRLFYLDEKPQPPNFLNLVKGDKAREQKRNLIALDLATGKELWRREGVPGMVGNSPGVVQVSQGVVVANGGFACDAAKGNVLWQQEVRCDRPPLIHGDWVITQPYAYNLKTGKQRETVDPQTGDYRAWQFAKSYGCGAVSGSTNLLFFRSGTFGFYDILQEGTTNFGGARPNCSISMIAANGLLIMPEAAAGCSCSYNFQTSLALYPADAGAQPWYAFASGEEPKAIRQLRVNFGAPGDRKDAAGNVWLGYPRPPIRGRIPVLLAVLMDQPEYAHQLADPHANPDRPDARLYDSDVRGFGDLLLDVDPLTVVPAGICRQTPTIDGKLDEAIWNNAPSADFQIASRTTAPRDRLTFLRDDQNLYVGYREEARVLNGQPVPPIGTATGEDARTFDQDDRIELVLTDARKLNLVHLGVSCAGGRYDAKGARNDRSLDGSWKGAWQSAVVRAPSAWSAELCIPLAILQAAGLDPATLLVNAMVVRRNPGEGETLYLIAPGGSGFGGLAKGENFLPLTTEPQNQPERSFTVRLHVRADAKQAPGWKVTVGDQTKPGPAGGPAAAPVAVLEFKGVKVKRFLTIRLSPQGNPTPEARPAICALEVMAEP